MSRKSGQTLRLAHYLAKGSMDIYADICTVYGSKSMSFFTVCRPIRKFSAGVGSVTSAPKSCRSKSASSKDCLKNIFFFLVKSDATYTSQQITDMVGISKALAFNIIGCNSFDPAVVLKSVTLNPIVYIFVTTFSPNLISSKLLDARLL